MLNKQNLLTPENVKAAIESVLEDERDEDGCDVIVTYQPVVDKNGVTVAVLEVCNCECGDRTVSNLFTAGNEALEELAFDFGFREEYC